MSNTPSDAEIGKLAAEHFKAFSQFPMGGQVWFEGEVEFARAVLAKWAAPQQEAQEPYAYAVYFPDQPKVELVHDLDELIDDLTNRPHAVTKLYTAPQPAPAPLSERDAFEVAWEKLHGKRPVLWSHMFAEHKMETPSHSEGKYFARDEQAAWKLWQARAALAAQGGE